LFAIFLPHVKLSLVLFSAYLNPVSEL